MVGDIITVTLAHSQTRRQSGLFIKEAAAWILCVYSLSKLIHVTGEKSSTQICIINALDDLKVLQ